MWSDAGNSDQLRARAQNRPSSMRRLAVAGIAAGACAPLLTGAGTASANARADRLSAHATCASLGVSADFKPPPGNSFGPVKLAEQALPAGSEPGLEQGSGCKVSVTSTASSTPDPLGFFDLATFKSVAAAATAFKTIKSDEFAGTTIKPAQGLYGNGSTSSTQAGNQAFQSSVGGGVQVGNTIFFFRWFPKTPADAGISVTAVLKHVASEIG